MCRAMAADPEIHDELQEKCFRKQLAATVRKIQWSYAIFWSISNRLPGVLAWSDGYYNGEIKTRKMTQPVELKADQMDLRRSEQLRELYESLSAGDSNQQTRRPSASLSPEDLTDTEWYYLVCMSFTFTPGQGLPGKALVNNQHVWLSNAQFSDSKIFSRSLLAKSASIQTVMCIPFMGGVLELGTTEMILEDPALVEQITSFFWALPVPAFSEQSVSSPEMAEDEKLISNPLVLEDQNLIAEIQTRSQTTTHFSYHSRAPAEQVEVVEKLHTNICEELKISSPGDESNECFSSQHLEDFFGMDDEFSNGLHCSLNSNEYVSMSFVNAQRVVSSTNGDRIRNQMLDDHLQEGSQSRIISLYLDGDDSQHYAKTVATILRNSRPAKPVSYFLKVSRKSDFMVWRRGLSTPKTINGTPQRLLKKILVSGELFRDGCPKKHQEDNGILEKAWQQGISVANDVLAESKRGENLNEKFLVLQSLIPCISKADKATIVGDAIDYLKDLERRVQELESCRDSAELERASDPCGNTETTKNGRTPSANKRKACDFVEAEAENHWLLPSKAGPIDVNVTMNEKEVAVEMRCPWRDCLVLEIVESISHLHLDPHSMQSSTADGMLALTIKSKIRGSIVASPGMIKRSLQRVIGKCL